MKKIILAFKIARGGRFNNPGYIHFLGEREEGISYYTDDLFIRFEHEDEYLKSIGGRPNLLTKFEKCSYEEDFSWFEEKFGWNFGERVYFDEGGNPVGLTAEECGSGIGAINIDNDYDTTYNKYSDDLTEEEVRAMRDRGQGYFGLNVNGIIEWYEENLHY